MKANYINTKFNLLSPSEQKRVAYAAAHAAQEIVVRQREADFTRLLDITVMTMLLTLNDEGFGKVRLARFLDAFERNITNYSEYGEALADALGFHLRERGIDYPRDRWNSADILGDDETKGIDHE